MPCGKLAGWSLIYFSVAQTRSLVDKINDEEYEMSKPLARYADDEDLEKMLKARLRDEDPMLKFMKKKKSTPLPDTKGIACALLLYNLFVHNL